MARVAVPASVLLLAAFLVMAASLFVAPAYEGVADAYRSALYVEPAMFVRVPENIVIEGDAELHHSIGEVQRVRDCFKKGGADLVYREIQGNITRYHLLCKEPDGTWADRIIEKVKDVWYERTAFEPKRTADWEKVRAWLERKGATRVNPKNLPW